jgi:hypothetical protein
MMENSLWNNQFFFFFPIKLKENSNGLEKVLIMKSYGHKLICFKLKVV